MLTRHRPAWLALAAALLLLAAFGPRLRPAPAAHPDSPQPREFTFTASEIDHELMPGAVVKAWGYNGQVPGPELRVTEGDAVRVTLRNDLPVPTTIHWHGVDVTPAMDGPAGLNQAPVEPGETFVYEFVARPSGTRWYHSHTDPALQVRMGLYGAFIVEPREGGRAYDREYTYILNEWDLELIPDVAAGRAPRGAGDQLLRGGELGADFFLMNGHIHDAIPRVKLATGDRVLIRLINAGDLSHAIHSHGHSFRIMATDGNPVPEDVQRVKDTVLIGPAERYDLELVGTNPGVWMFHCHMEHHMANGMATLIQYEGAEPSGPAVEFWDPVGALWPSEESTDAGGAAGGGTYDGHGEEDAGADLAPDTPTAAPTEVAAPSPTPSAVPESTASPEQAGNVVEIAMVDDRFEPAVSEVPAGTTVVWVNQGQDWHSIAAFDGSFESDRIGSGETFTYTFAQPGAYQYICKHHGLQGMVGRVTVT